jgi:uncharacterized protein (DUF2062 family)
MTIPTGVDQLFRFLRSQWQEIVIPGIWIPIVITALTTGSIIFIVLSLIGGALVMVALYSLIDKIQKTAATYLRRRSLRDSTKGPHLYSGAPG